MLLDTSFSLSFSETEEKLGSQSAFMLIMISTISSRTHSSSKNTDSISYMLTQCFTVIHTLSFILLMNRNLIFIKIVCDAVHSDMLLHSSSYIFSWLKLRVLRMQL